MQNNLFVLIFFLFTIGLTAQNSAETDAVFKNNSKVELTTVSPQQIEDLAVLGRVWGFLKYHHPKVCSGKLNWDFELFRIMPRVLNAKNTVDRDQILLAWINELGEVLISQKCEEPKGNVKLKPDHDWIDDPKISKNLSEILHFIYKNRNVGSSHYGDLTPLGGVALSQEEGYKHLKKLDVGYRLLSLFRYWNIVHYYFPYKYAIEENNWNDLLTKSIPEFVAATDHSIYLKTLKRLVVKVQDSHANFPLPNGLLRTPIVTQFIGNELVVKTYANDSVATNCPLKVGDIIKKVDNKTIESLIEYLTPLTAGSNKATVKRNLTYDILRGDSPVVRLTVEREGKTLEYTLNRIKNQFKVYSYVDSVLSKDFKIADDIGYINIEKIKLKQVNDAFEKIKDTRGLVIDIRNYPSDFVIYAIGAFLSKSATPFCRMSRGSKNNPGYFILQEEPLKVGSNNDLYSGKIAILVNEMTQSSAEFHAMAFQTAAQAKVFGSQTAGADGNISRFMLPGGISTQITGIGVYYPDGRETQRIGIVPDVEVKQTILGIKARKDEVLEKAIEWIRL